MLARQDIGDWIQIAVVVIAVLGSAVGGIVKAIIAKANKQAGGEPPEGETAPPVRAPRPIARPMSPPMARPMPPPGRRASADGSTERTPAPPIPPPRRIFRPTADRTIEIDVPESVRPIVEMMLGRVPGKEPKPQHAPPRRSKPERSRRPAPPPPERETLEARGDRLREIENRETQESRNVEQRIGHVETHVAPAVTEADRPTRASRLHLRERSELRRAMILREILGPPLSLRSPVGE